MSSESAMIVPSSSSNCAREGAAPALDGQHRPRERTTERATECRPPRIRAEEARWLTHRRR
jgi:hypothetical protein